MNEIVPVAPDASAADELAAAKAAAKAALAGAGTLVPLGGASPEVTRQAYAAQRAEATRALTRAQSAATAIREQVRKQKEELERRLNAQLADLEATLAPLKEQAARLQEGLWTVNLYLGRDEEINRLAEGAPAPAGTPIVLRQLVLAMDEECLVAADDQGIDATRTEEFAQWLLRDPAHLRQVLPDPKGVVVLMPTRQERDYGSGFANLAMEKANRQSHWLIRNGDNLYMMITDLDVGDRLLPKRDEFVDFFYASRDPFRGGERVPLEPGGDDWVKAEQRADARRRHYMRVMLVLQGLADRTTVFQPLPDSGVSFLSLDSQDAGTVRIINELDHVLTSGRKPFGEWQAELNAQLRPGMRIIGEFGSRAFRECNENDRQHGWGHSRLRPEAAEYPDSRVIHYIESKDGRDLKFLYERTRTEWIGGELRAPRVRASCRVRATDEFILPFDLVTEAELVTYLNARTERHGYLAMVPVLKAAIAAKQREAAEEEPFRTLLAGRIAGRHGLDVREVQAQLHTLIDWWKLTNRHHRPLVTAGDPELEAKAIRGIEREYATRLRAAGGADAARDARAVEQIRRELTNHGDDPADSTGEVICVARRTDGSYVAYCPEPNEREKNVWLTEHRYTKSLAGRSIRNWVTLSGRSRAALTILWSAPDWKAWNHDADRREHLTRREYNEVIAAMTSWISPEGTPILVTYARGNESDGQIRCFAVYAWAHNPEPLRRPEDADIGTGMVKRIATWSRDRAGDVELTFDRARFNPHWKAYGSTDAPWEEPGSYYAKGRPHLLWSDPQQMARVQERQAAIRERAAANRERNDRIHAVVRHIENQWLAAEEKRQYERFLDDYAGATDLWEGHRKTLKIDVPRQGRDSSLYGLVGRVLAAGADPVGMTVAQAAAAYPGDTPFEVPDNFAELLLASPATEVTPDD